MSDCPRENCPIGECRTDVHHLMWPAHEYKTPVERTFRNLPENKVEICRWAHTEIHYVEEPPEKPEIEHMKTRIMVADFAGEICLSATRRRAVYGR